MRNPSFRALISSDVSTRCHAIEVNLAKTTRRTTIPWDRQHSWNRLMCGKHTAARSLKQVATDRPITTSALRCHCRYNIGHGPLLTTCSDILGFITELVLFNSRCPCLTCPHRVIPNITYYEVFFGQINASETQAPSPEPATCPSGRRPLLNASHGRSLATAISDRRLIAALTYPRSYDSWNG